MMDVSVSFSRVVGATRWIASQSSIITATHIEFIKRKLIIEFRMYKRPRLEPQKESECDELVDAYELFLLTDAKPTDEQADRLRQDTMRMWPFLHASHLSKIVWVVCRVDSVELYWFLVSLGLDLTYKQGVLPVELAIRANAIEIIESLKGNIVYKECVTSGRLVIEAMHQGDPEHLRCLLSLGASMDESHGKYGTAFEMSIWQGL